MVYLEYTDILGCFVKDEVMRSGKISEIDPRDRQLHKPVQDIYLGGRCTGYLATASDSVKGIEFQLKTDCQKFLIEVTVQIRKRFPLNEESLIA